MEEYDYEIRYKPGVQNSNVDALSRIYAITEIKEKNYEHFLNKLETTVIINNYMKETEGTLLESPCEYSIVSEIVKQYNFRTGINYELKQKFGNNKNLPVSKVIGILKTIIVVFFLQ